MAAGTSGDVSELNELKETVRQSPGRIEILSAQNSDLNSRLIRSLERFQELARKFLTQSSVVSHAKEAEKIPIKNLPKVSNTMNLRAGE